MGKILYPNIDAIVRATNGRYELLRSIFEKYSFEVFRIADSDSNAYVYGGPVFRYPYPAGKGPQQTYISRETYERILRGLTRGSSSRIRWLVGTATDVEVDNNDPMRISSVIIRGPVNTEKKIPASLVIGEFKAFA